MDAAVDARTEFLRGAARTLMADKTKVEVVIGRGGAVVTDCAGTIEEVEDGGFVMQGQYMQMGAANASGKPMLARGRIFVLFDDVIRIAAPSEIMAPQLASAR